VRKVTHRINGNGFTTDFSITQRSHSSLLGMLRRQMLEEPSPNQPERMYGLVVAEVVDNNEQLAGKVPTGRVKLKFPAMSNAFTSGWAPCASPMAGQGMGFYALPEKGDQVLVAFANGELCKPYVIGSLWNAKSQPPAANQDGKNSQRIIKSKAGHAITFDDNADGGNLTIQDKAGSSITLNAKDGSITISAENDLTIHAKGKISIEAADGKTKISMTQDKVDVT
jgi:uncharacterized protein involved in type VI secretion and phage assembly